MHRQDAYRSTMTSMGTTGSLDGPEEWDFDASLTIVIIILNQRQLSMIKTNNEKVGRQLSMIKTNNEKVGLID